MSEINTLGQFIESEIQRCHEIATASAELGLHTIHRAKKQKISLLNQVLETMAPAQELIENFIDARVEKVIEDRVEEIVENLLDYKVEEIVDCKLDDQLETMVRDIIEENDNG